MDVMDVVDAVVDVDDEVGTVVEVDVVTSRDTRLEADDVLEAGASE